MAKEIERKFLVTNDTYKTLAYECRYIKQGYVSTDKYAIVRIRVIDNESFITIKTATIGMTRNEWEYSIPLDEACEMLENVSQGCVIEKNRYFVNYCGYIWEIDEFLGVHKGLVVAEIELRAEDESVPLPSFIGEEVTGISTYYNSSLALNP